jgi:hypothetical protein
MVVKDQTRSLNYRKEPPERCYHLITMNRLAVCSLPLLREYRRRKHMKKNPNRIRKPKTAYQRTFQKVERKPAQIGWFERPELPTDDEAALYPRVSTPGQLGNVSSEMQLEENGRLWKLAIECGWKPGQIHEYKQDMALSGQLLMEERPSFKALLQDIVSGKVKAVIAIDVDRLFRDKWGKEYAKFMEICEKYHVIVITPRFIYDFRNPNHVKLFRDEAVRAWDYMENQIYGKLHAAKDFLSSTGRFSGHKIPTGLTVDRDKKSPTYRRYKPIEEYRSIVIGIYERCRDLGFNVNRLFRELNKLPFVFPDLPDLDPRTEGCMAMRKVPGGYSFSAPLSLQRYLINLALIGIKPYKTDVIRDENGKPIITHEPIIPPERQEELFWPVFNRYSPFLLDGTPNPRVKKRNKVTQDGKEEPDAMLRYIIDSSDPGYFIYIQPRYSTLAKRNGQYMYAFVEKAIRTRNKTGGKYMLRTREIDSLFWKRLAAYLHETDDFEAFAEAGEQEKARKEREEKEILAQVDACKSTMAKITKNLAYVDEPELIKAMNDQFKMMNGEKARLEERLVKLQTANEDFTDAMISWHELLAELGDHLEALENYTTLEERQQLAHVFAREVTLKPLSARVYQLVITWRYPEWGAEALTAIREGYPSHLWTEEEDEIIRQHYPSLPYTELLPLLPTRTRDTIRHRAVTLNVTRQIFDKSPIPNQFAWEDWLLVQEHDLMNGVKIECVSASRC